ncbi:MAG: hypothetical protein E7001_00045 [Coriobacteriaceae bacterium]|nr:hypothetical protein [Coriobacteriaceae bacterium]
MFRVDIDEFSSAATVVSSAATRAGESVTRVGKVNSGFASLMSGAWATAESRAYADLEVTLRMLTEGLTAMGDTYADALASLTGEVAPTRDALLSAARSNAASPQVVRFEPYHNVAGACDFAVGSLEDLKVAVAAAQSALDGLESSGGVSGPLSALSSLAGTQGSAIDEIRASYVAYEAAVDAFEEEYANRLAPGEFVTESMRDTVVADLHAQYGEALDNGPFAFIDVFGDVSVVLSAVGGGAAAMDRSNAALWRYALSFMCGEEGRGLKLVDRQWLSRFALGLSDDVRSAIPEGQTFWQFFKKGFESEVTDWVKPSEWKKSYEGVRGLVGDLGERVRAFYSGSKGAIRKADDLFTSVESVGTHIDNAVKGLGYMGTALSVFDTVGQAGAAFNSTVGDGYDKTAAAVVEVGEGLVEFTAGAAVGATVGAIGGPVGVAAGVAIGWVAGELLDAGLKWLDDEGFKDRAVDGIGDAFRAVGDLFGL